MKIAAPQTVILVGALIGGLAAFYVLRSNKEKVTLDSYKHSSNEGKQSRTLLGTLLLSAIVTILLARLSQSQFLIQVSISDFWGAIAIGFVASYYGPSLLDNWLRQHEKEKQNG
ncbi:MAG: hypothetical protein JO182_23535 [Acidobacteriaceae bacterium]|nr:hypothetical protein [Acidobacteriaceae bacterium]MBV9305868.1 hypothetical protein [Acidobacteriaceae bacterium]MBV9939435.1 hypothetical protein [Acidobacteriaceae bacterium]